MARAALNDAHERPLRVCVVGAGMRFMSGISVYTVRLANALAQQQPTAALLMRQLLPTFLYPGKRRVGSDLTQMTFDKTVPVFDGVDWYWLPSMLRAILFLLRIRPQIMVFQWWTGTVLHSYLLLALVARALGAKIVIEFHEVLDTGEARIPVVQTYTNALARLILRLTDACTVHSAFDRDLLSAHYPLGARPIAVIPHSPFDQFRSAQAGPVLREAPPDVCNLLFFGIIRPYKGLEDLVRAFDSIPEDEIGGYWLTVVGETWEGWTLPTELIAQSRYRDRITFVNRYVHDEEVTAFFNGANAVVLPYHRSSMSGPLQVAMGHGLPLVITAVGGLSEAVQSYEGAITIPPESPDAIRTAIRAVAQLRGQHFTSPQSWDDTATRYRALFATLLPHEQTA